MGVPETDSQHSLFEATLGLYLVGALPPGEVDAFERHLGVCSDCCAEADALGDAVAALVMLPRGDGDALAEQFGLPTPARAAELDR